MGKNCVRCGDEIETGLRCKSCREYVDDEIYGGKERDLEFYFKRHKQNATTRNTTGEKQQTKDFHGGRSIRGTTRHSLWRKRQSTIQIQDWD